ncbi:MAG TPA: class I SAM-dependent methyltransferase, partial [Bryobacteraceae bacterium]|nr:class I SAM-dependent methyltransferase [Bryobacteraceae bacterium]
TLSLHYPTVTAELAGVREALERFSYTAESVVELLGAERLPLPGAPEMAHFLHLTRGNSPLTLLVRLFLLGVPVPAAVARVALGDHVLAGFQQCGLLAICGETLEPLCRLQPFRGMVIACDHADTQGREQIMGITESTMQLADSGQRQRAGSTLDLGTGTGVVALAATSYSRSVTGTDISPRALAFARFNAALNGISNIEFEQGDSFQPVRGRRFDLILSNPPFAITPGVRFTYRDSGLAGDEFCRRLIRAAPEHLEEGGFAQCTCDWIQTAGQDWTERLKSWFEGIGCDAWVLRTQTDTAADYAAKWIRDTEYGAGEERRKLYDEWARFYEREGIAAVSTGLIVLRRRSGGNRVRFDDAPEVLGAFGDDIAAAFAAQDFLEEASEDAFLNARLKLHPAARLEQELEPSPDGWKVAAARVRITRGLRWAGNVDGHAAALLARCNGLRTVREATAAFAAALGAPPERVTPGAAALLRQMVARGYLRANPA